MEYVEHSSWIQEDYPCVMASDACTGPRALLWCGWMCTHHIVDWALSTAEPCHESLDVLVHKDTRKICEMCGTMSLWVATVEDDGPIVCEDCAMVEFDRIQNGGNHDVP